MAPATPYRPETGSELLQPRVLRWSASIVSITETHPHRLKLIVQLMVGDEIAFGPGKAELLDAIRGGCSISAAAREMGLGYRRA